MSKNQKKLSHWQRRNCYDCRPVTPAVPVVDEKRLFVYDEIDEPSGRVIRKSELRSIDRVAEMKHFRCADFSLENMLSVGANLQPVKFESSGFAMLDNLEYQSAKLANTIKQEQSNLKTE